MKKYCSLLFLILSFACIGQTKEQIVNALQGIDTPGKAEELILNKPTWDIEIVTLSPYDEEVPKKLFALQKGHSKVLQSSEGTYHYKLLKTIRSQEFRVSYIYLNGKELLKKEIDALRPQILEKYKNGMSFETLAEIYNMDANSNKGDLGWIKSGVMVPEFEKAIKRHQKGDIFTVDVVRRQWYYIVLKTFDDRNYNSLIFIKTKVQ